MAKGRKSQPDAVKAAKGNPGKRPLTLTEPDSEPVKIAAAPSDLTASGKSIYRDLASKLQSVKLLRDTDMSAFTRYCDSLADYWKVTKQLRKSKHTLLVKTVAGGTMPRTNPLFMVQDRLERRLIMFEDRFGLSPRSRQEVMYRMAQSAQPNLPNNPTDTPQQNEQAGPIGFLGGGNGAVGKHNLN